MGNDRVMTCWNIKVLQKIMSPSGESFDCIKNGGRRAEFPGKVCVAFSDRGLSITMRDERHREQEIGNGART